MVKVEQRSSDSEAQSQSQQEKGDGIGKDEATTVETVYPTGMRLAFIVAALFLAVFLFALDMVRSMLPSCRETVD
jgi:hypothetical protein